MLKAPVAVDDVRSTAVTVVVDCCCQFFVLVVCGCFVFRLGFVIWFFQSELPRPIKWNQTLDVHRRSTLIT